MSDIGLIFGPFDLAALALIIGAPGLVIGAAVGVAALRNHRIAGALFGAAVGFTLWLGGFAAWKMSPWG